MATKVPKKSQNIAIKVEGVSKSFKIPHEKHNSLKSAALNIFKKKSYTQFEALKDISFEVKQGEFFGIIGRNGCGKSTLLKMLAGIYVPNSGKISMNGKLSPFLELGVGFNPELTGRENVYLGGAILGLSKKEVDDKFKEIVEFAELEEFIDMRFKNYSSGMQVRLAFALSINAHAEIVLMDEVLAVGDVNFQQKCLKKLVNLRNQNKTIVLVSHSMESVERYCDTAIYISDGMIVSRGKTAKVLNDYYDDNIEIQKDNNNKYMSDKQIEPDNQSLTSSVFESVEVLHDNKVTESLNIGDKFTIRVRYKLKEIIDNAILGLAINKDGGQIIFGTNSTELGVKIGKTKSGIFEFVFDSSLILDGFYGVNIAIADENDLIEKSANIANFSVSKNKRKTYGVCDLRPKASIVKNDIKSEIVI